MSVPAPRVDYTRLSPNRSSRNGQRIVRIVLHATEGQNLPGIQDLRNLGSWFAQREAGVSCTIATDAEGHSARYCPDDAKAWHCGAYNGSSLGIEQVGFTSQTTWPEAQLQATARWVAYWSVKHGIPLVRSTSHGVCTHRDLGVAGGNHGDPGSGYSVAQVLNRAKAIVAGKTGETGYDSLTEGEQDHVDALLYERRIKYRHGGSWSTTDPIHRQRANAAAAWLEARLRTIATGSTKARPARRAYIRHILDNGTITRP